MRLHSRRLTIPVELPKAVGAPSQPSPPIIVQVLHVTCRAFSKAALLE